MKYKRCPNCGATNYHDDKYCYRCDSELAIKREKSLLESFAFWIAGIIFYIPANLYPILNTSKFSTVEGSTIIEGVFQLYDKGDFPIALIIFVASIMIPIIKFVLILYLIVNIKLKRYQNHSQKVRLYHLIEFVGPWSLIDVFVVIILASLIHFSTISIIPGFGATSFAIMVLFTTISANRLDVRLLKED